jgi:hypothetical protein
VHSLNSVKEDSMNRRIVIAGTLLGLTLLSAAALADEAKKAAGNTQAASTPVAAVAAAAAANDPGAGHRMLLPGDFKWTDGPPSLPKGAKVAVIHGDMTAPGIFAIRAMLPAGYKVPPHFHPADENVTVISGELYMGMGDTWDEAKGHALPPGSVSVMPVGTHHFAWTKVETVIQIHAMGPWGITYINPQDDPRNAKQATK